MGTQDDTTRDRGILNCGESGQVVFDYACPLSWALLDETEDARKRFCSECDRHVFWCHSAEEAALRARQGECIAVPFWLVKRVHGQPSTHEHIAIGRPANPGERIIEAYAEEHGEEPPEGWWNRW